MHPPEPAAFEQQIYDFFAQNNFERSRRFAPGAYDSSILKARLSEYANPQRAYETIHVAGTVGKGSTTTYLARGLQSLGYKTGTYLSPHFLSLRERFLLDGNFISDSALQRLWQELNAKDLSLFDALTLMAFLFFKQEGVQWAVIETGLGGRLDSTNNLNAGIAVITRIGMDHQNILGNTLEKIASEKAGIIQQGQKVFTIPQNESVMQVLRETCAAKHATLTMINPPDADFDSQNRYVAAEIIRLALGRTPQPSNEGIFGRWSVLKETPRVVFDSAHNVSGIEALAALVNRQPESDCQIFLNTMTERDLSELAGELKARVKKNMRLLFFPFNDPRYYGSAPEGFEAPDDDEINLLLTAPGKLNIFAGSMGIYAELRRRFAL